MRGSSRTYTPPMGYGDPARIRGTKSHDEEEGPHAWSEGEQDLDPESSTRFRGRGQWNRDSDTSGAVPPPASPPLGGTHGQYRQTPQPLTRYGLSQNPDWSSHRKASSLKTRIDLDKKLIIFIAAGQDVGQFSRQALQASGRSEASFVRKCSLLYPFVLDR